MTADHEPSGQFRVRVGVSVQVPDAVNNRSLPREDLPGFTKTLNAGIVVPGQNPDRKKRAKTFKYLRDLPVLLPAGERDTVLDVPEKDEAVRLGIPYASYDPFGPFTASALEIKAMPGHIGLDTQVEIRDHKYPSCFFYEEGGAFRMKLQSHRIFMTSLDGW
jgi:hypothetical protein